MKHFTILLTVAILEIELFVNIIIFGSKAVILCKLSVIAYK
jgi:hypothetical protein